LNDGHVDRIQNDDRVFVHAQCGGSVNPMAIPASRAQLRENFGGVVTALCRDDDVATFQCIDVEGILQRRFVFGRGRRFAASVGGGEKQRFDQTKVALGLHAVHQDGTDHATPAYKSYQFHVITLSMFILRFRLVEPEGRDEPELLALGRFRDGFHNGLAHFAGADHLCAFRPDVDRAQT